MYMIVQYPETDDIFIYIKICQLILQFNLFPLLLIKFTTNAKLNHKIINLGIFFSYLKHYNLNVMNTILQGQRYFMRCFSMKILYIFLSHFT